jgi:hypothetical protein
MMSTKSEVLVGVVVALCLSTIVLAQSVAVDFDKPADFSRFRTYAWVAATNVPDELNHKRILRAVEDQLIAKGLAKVDVQNGPDLLVAYHASFERDLQITGYGGGLPYRFGGGSMSARAETIVKGTVVIDLVDAVSQAIVWRATATSDIDVAAKAEKRDRNISRTAEKMFKNYPPKTTESRK